MIFYLGKETLPELQVCDNKIRLQNAGGLLACPENIFLGDFVGIKIGELVQLIEKAV
jgi:hypothetical protein